MATQRNLKDLVGDDAEATPEDKKTPRRGGSTKPAEKGSASAGKAKGKGKPASTPATASDSAPAPEQAKVLVPSQGEGERVGLVLHADDFRDLGLAKLDDKADFNSRIRAMIAVWRTNSRYRAQVDKLARTAPRGPHKGMPK